MFAAGSALASNSVPPDSQSIQLKLANGDSISGALIRETPEHIVLRSDLLGEISVPRSALAAPATPPPAPKPPEVVVTKKPEPKPAAQGVKPSAKPWRSKIEFGILFESGRNDASRQHILGEAEKTFGEHTVRATGRLNYAKQNKASTADRTEATFRWRQNLDKHTFTQTQTTYYRDNIAAIDINLEQNIGLGYRLFDNNRHTFNIGAGLTGQYREADNIDSNTGALAEFFQDQTIKLSDTTKLIQTLTLQYWPSAPLAATAARDEDNLKWRFSTKLEGKLSGHMTINLRYEYDYDSAVTNPAARDNQRITSSLGYVF